MNKDRNYFFCWGKKQKLLSLTKLWNNFFSQVHIIKKILKFSLFFNIKYIISFKYNYVLHLVSLTKLFYNHLKMNIQLILQSYGNEYPINNIMLFIPIYIGAGSDFCKKKKELLLSIHGHINKYRNVELNMWKNN